MSIPAWDGKHVLSIMPLDCLKANWPVAHMYIQQMHFSFNQRKIFNA